MLNVTAIETDDLQLPAVSDISRSVNVKRPSRLSS